MAFGKYVKYSRYLTYAYRNAFLRPVFQNYFSNSQQSHTYHTTIVEDPIVITDDGSTIVCWHPEKEFPYEYTKSLPVENNVQTTLLKTTEQEAYKVFKKQSPEFVREELMKMTYTTKHRWFPRSRDKRAKKTQMDRRYL